VATALFVMIEHFPGAYFINIVAVILIIGFFITSSDSGSLVVDSLTSGGKLDAPVGQRIFWANMEGLVAAVLLLGGGLGALQTAAITTGLPFTLVLCFMCYSLVKGFEEEHQEMMNIKQSKERESYKEMLKGIVERRKKQNN
jgi:choline/glycine/proline betaine transport protein